MWQSRFGSEISDLGATIKINDESITVIGVMPASFQYPFRTALWAPLWANEKAETLGDRAATHFTIIAALSPGASAGEAEAEIEAILQRSAPEESKQEASAAVTPLREAGMAKYRTPIIVLQFAVVFVLLIASANLANLMLARAAARRQEFAVRLALGAGRARIIRQLLVESLVVGALGSVVGLMLAAWGQGALRGLFVQRIPGLYEIKINGPVLLFTVAVSIITALLFGLAPAVMASRENLNEVLKSGSASVSLDPRRRNLSKALVIAEVGLAVVLLSSAGLMIRTFFNLTGESPGFNPERAVAVSLSLPQSQYPNYQSLASYFDRAAAQARALPGVEYAGAIAYMPLVGYNPGVDFTIEGRPTQQALRADFQAVTPHYFEAMEIPLVAGRPVEESDMKVAPDVALINNALAKRYWPGENPLGKHIKLAGGNAPQTLLKVVGVVGDVKQFGLHADPRPEIYLPAYRHSMTMIVRAGDSSLLGSLEDSVQKVDSRAAVTVRAMDQVVYDSIERRRIFAFLLIVLAAVALAMASMGIYGVVSYSVTQRTREIGIRCAMGASGPDILRLILGQGARLAVAGVAIGIALSLATARALSGMLYGVSVTDPAVLIGLASVMILVSLVASYIPARRASRVDPIVALREQ
jgi:putative ABC transport system permease protein